MNLTDKVSKNNYYSFLWHAVFLALAQNFMDIDTIIPAMMIDAGGTPLHIGILTAIMIGSGRLSQLIFAPFLSNKPYKRKFLLSGINARIITLIGMTLLFVFSSTLSNNLILLLIFILIFIFSISGGFANINYTDILGKSVLQERRKHFFSIKQVVSSIGVLISAYFARYLLRIYDYPQNYTILFFIAAVLLIVASLGFWKIKEVAAENLKIRHLREFFQIIKKEFKTNKKFAHYLLLTNTQGVSLVLLPFLILYAKETFGAGGQNIGNYLLLKVIGGVITGGIMFYGAKKIRYHYLLYIISLLSILITISILIFPGDILFPYIFLFGGLVYAFYRIAIGGVLLEITTNKNRALYTGLSGAGNILPAIFPLLGGWIVNQFGFIPFFIIFIIIITISFYFTYKLDCQK